MDLLKYPKELTNNRQQIEAAFVFTLWKEPDLFGEYTVISQNPKNELITTLDGKFYYLLGLKMFEKGYRNYDEITVSSYLQDYPEVKKEFDIKGGMATVKELTSLVHEDNIDGYYDNLVKANILLKLYDKGFDVLGNIDKFKEMTSEDVYDFFDYQLNSVAIESNHNFEIEDLLIDDEFLAECERGDAQGLSYKKYTPIMNSMTMGIPLGELFMIGGFSGSGKSSFVFENMILPLTMDNIKCTIISNEQRSKDFKLLLLVHVLTRDLGYYGLTRRKLKAGGFTDEQKEMLNKARDIIAEKYSDIKFVKLFDNDMDKVKKVIRKQAKVGHQVFMFDTMKSEDQIDEAMWQQLLIHSRKLFQLASKENISIICTYQLALSKLNTRYLDASCLSNAKQIKEVFSEMVYFRPLADDEYDGERYAVEPTRLEKDEEGKFTGRKIHMPLTDKDKRYLIAFIDKTRNGEDKKQILYEFNGAYNHWKEIGNCKVLNTYN